MESAQRISPEPRVAGVPLLGVGVALGVLVMLLMFDPSAAIRADLILPLAIGAPIVVWSVFAIHRNVRWLPLVFVLLETVLDSTLFPVESTVRPLISHGLLALYTLPLLPRVWRSGILWRDGFRDYTLYLALGVLSVTYSIAPAFSLSRISSATLVFPAICAIVLDMHDGNEARRTLSIFLVGLGIAVASNALALKLLGQSAWSADPWTRGIERFQGIFGQPNQIGALTLGTVGAGLGCWPVLGKRGRMACAAGMLVVIILDVSADSRSALAALAVGAGLYGIWRLGLKGLIPLAALAGALYVLANHPGVGTYLSRGDINSFSGRTVAWNFAVRAIKEKPLIGHGYQVDGAIFKSRYFPSWEEVWNQGPHSSIHEGYLSRAVGLGVPALLFWLYLMLRPAFSALRRNQDPWNLAPLIFLIFIPIMVFNLTETVSDCRGLEGMVLTFVWAVAERQRQIVIERQHDERLKAEALRPAAVQALNG